jgi:hypothetical protein
LGPLVLNAPTSRRSGSCSATKREDYGAALQRHYANGPPPDWQERFVSTYASTHPWEDWAETWAHYFHMVDTLETASAFGMRVRPARDQGRRPFGRRSTSIPTARAGSHQSIPGCR